MRVIIIILLALWVIFGNVPMTIADIFWQEEATPWETVDAFYYPDRNNLTLYRKMVGLKSVDECRVWVRWSSASNGDDGLDRGDYECGIGILKNLGTYSVYRNTVVDTL
jgi:hypothetical protein